MMLIGKILLGFMIMKPIITDKTIIIYFGNKTGKIWNLETTFHLTHGEGYYENYKQDAKFSKYDLPNIVENGNTITRTDFIRKNGRIMIFMVWFLIFMEI